MSAVSRNGLRFMHARKAVQLIDKHLADIPHDGPAHAHQQSAWLANMHEALAVAKKEVGLAEQADADVSAQQKALDRAEKTVKDAEARWSTINDASTSTNTGDANGSGSAKKGAAAAAATAGGGATAPNSTGGGNVTDKDADADAEAETEAEEDELHDEDEHPSTTGVSTAGRRAAAGGAGGAAENGNTSAEDAKPNTTKNEKSAAAQRKGGRVGPGGTVKRIVHDPKCERCASSGKQCVGIEGRACQPCGLMKMKCSMSSKVGRQPNASADNNNNNVSAPAPAATTTGTKSRAAAQRANANANGHGHGHANHAEPHTGTAASGSASGSGANAGAASVSTGKRTRDDDDALHILSATDPASASAAGVLTSLRSSSKRPRNNAASHAHTHNAHNAHTSTATAAEALKELKSSLSKDIKEANKSISSTAAATAAAKGKGRAALDDGALLRLVTPLLQMQSAMAEMSSELVKLIEKNKG